MPFGFAFPSPSALCPWLGGVEEFSVRAESLVLVIRMLSPDYFLAIVLRSDGHVGTCRYLMRLAPMV